MAKINMAGPRKVIESLMASTVTVSRVTKGRFSNGEYEDVTVEIYGGKAMISMEGSPNEIMLGGSPQRRLLGTLYLPWAEGSYGVLPKDRVVDGDGRKMIVQGVVSGTYEASTRVSVYLDQDVP